jgi:epoxyqueuosine reductase QueG
MNSLWEWKFCEKCNIWTEHYSETGGDRCTKCQTISPPFKFLNEKELKKILLEQEIIKLLKNSIKKDNTDKEIEILAKLLIKRIKKDTY